MAKMSKEIDPFAYMMAAEKICNLLFVIENTTDFFDEYEIRPDDEVRKALIPVLEKLNKWVKST